MQANQSLLELTADILKALAARTEQQPVNEKRGTSRTQNPRRRPPSYSQAAQKNHVESKAKQQQRPATPKTNKNNQQHHGPAGANKPKESGGRMTPKELGLSKIRNREKILILMRGCPGSGKTSLARQMQHDGVIFSADDYFLRNGRYVFDASRLNEAHAHVRSWCQRAIENNRTPVIIDNTNLEAWEMMPYVSMAVKHQYFLLLLEPETSWRYNPGILAAKNQHNIDYHRIVRMLEIFDRTLSAVQLIRCCKVSGNVDQKQQPKPPPAQFGNQPKVNKSPHRPRPRTPRPTNPNPAEAGGTKTRPTTTTPATNTGSSSSQSRETDSVGENEDWSSNDEDWTMVNLQPGQRCHSVPNISKEMESLSIHHSPSPFQPVTSPVLPPPPDSHINDLLDLDFSSKPVVEPVSSYPDVGPTPQVAEEKTEQMEDPIKVLKSFFPGVADDDLKDIFDKCKGDLEWVVNLLLDAGYAMCMPGAESGTGTKQNAPSEEENLIDLDVDKQTDDTPEPDVPNTQVPTISVTDEDDGREKPADTFRFRLDAGFAQLLQDTFGPVGYNLSSDSYSGSELDVPIPYELAAAIHECWSSTLRDKFKQEDVELVQMLNDEDYARLVQDEEAALASGFYPIFHHDEFPALKPSDNEAALAHNPEVWSSLYNQDLALKIKRKQLYEQFPQIDQKAIDDMLDSNNFQYAETYNTLKLLYEPDSIPQHVVAPEFSQEYEQYLLKTLAVQEVESETQRSVEEPEEEETFSHLRDRAQYLLGLRKECSDKAKAAFHSGLKDVASYYSQQGHRYTFAIQEANQRAAKMILDIMNNGRHPNTLDLHLLTTREALQALTEFLSRKQQEINSNNTGRKSMVVYVITGRGAHSQQGIAKIRAAVDSFLKTKNYSCYQVNAGCVEVLLRKNGS